MLLSATRPQRAPLAAACSVPPRPGGRAARDAAARGRPQRTHQQRQHRARPWRRRAHAVPPRHSGGGAGASVEATAAAGRRPPADPAAGAFWWRSVFPGDSGWDPLNVRRSTDATTFSRIREVEVLHARWAMLGVLSLLLGDVAGMPFPPAQLTAASLAPWGVLALAGLALLESYRLAALWGEEDFDARAYPGKRFDVLGLTRSASARRERPPPQLSVWASWLGGFPGWLVGGWWFEQQDMTEAELWEMKARELRNGRLAMVSFVGCVAASALTGKGPLTLLAQHVADPLHHTILSALQ